MKIDFDVNAFIQEQNLEVDDDVKHLLNAELDLKKRKRKAVEEEEEESEDDLEMAAYNDMMQNDTEFQQKVYINRTEALLSRLHDIQSDPSMDWTETLVVTSTQASTLNAEDMNDDLKKELHFYEQALEAAKIAKDKIINAGIPFSRPDDYFAEMVKSDDHMKRVKQRLLDDAQALKASEMARKQREAKKFGKKVQQEKLAEREKKARDETEKIKLARKKKSSTANIDDEFNLDVSKESAKKTKKNAKSNKKVQKDAKFGYGGQKRNRKSNTAESTADLGAFSVKKMKGKSKQGRVVKRK